MEPRTSSDYGARQIEAARRVLVDLGQVLGGFRDCIVVVGGWVPDLLIPDATDPHVGSIDVDLALDVKRLIAGRYAELLKLLIETRRYQQGEKAFQLVTAVDLQDGNPAVVVEVDFLAPQEVKLRGSGRVKGFRVLQADGCAAAFRAPEVIDVSGPMIDGSRNTVQVRVASLADFLVMKCHALAGRDKPKDAYDIVYCLDHVAGGPEAIAAIWRERTTDADVTEAVRILREKFAGIDSFGPERAAGFLDAASADGRAIAARRAFELVQAFLKQLLPR
jgi:Nucleotidyl transferase AbiEii toxin, Type IV TA system